MPKSLSKPLAFLIALSALLVGGVLHGMNAERWTESDALKQAAERVARTPLEMGDWTGKELESDPVEFERAGARGYWTRLYTNRRTGASMLAILMVGRAGRMAVHTPEVCYRGAGYDLMETPSVASIQTELGDPLGQFWMARFAKQTGRTSDLRLYWSWSANGTWEAPENPRWQFRNVPCLYKLYVSHDTPPAGSTAASPTGSNRASSDPAGDFFRQLLPVLNTDLFPAPTEGVS